MALEYFPCYHSYYKKIAKLSDQEVGRLFRSLLKYSETGEAPELTGRESVAFDFIADDIDRAKNSYDERCLKNKENVTKRYDRIQSNTTVYESYQSKDKSKDKDKIKKESTKKKSVAFVHPTLDEVKAYVKERKSSVDADRFYEYYSAGDWKDAKGNPVKNWKQKLITWEQHQQFPKTEKERDTTYDLDEFEALLAQQQGG